MLAVVAQVLGRVRKAKSEAKVKQRTEVLSATITAPAAQVEQLQAGLGDLKAAGNARELTVVEGETGDALLLVGDVRLAPPEETGQA